VNVAWHPDPEFWSANRAEHAFVGPYELVAFDLPARNGFPAEIGWELFGGIERMEQLDSGRGVSFEEARQNAEKALTEYLRYRRAPSSPSP
jgi:hypothetical protein